MPSSSPYQSQLLTTLIRQGIRWRDRVGVAARRARTALAWGAQVVLYPIYIGFQASRLVGRQLGQTVKRSLRQLQARRASQPSTAKSSKATFSNPPQESPQFSAVDTPLLRSFDVLHSLLLEASEQQGESTRLLMEVPDRIALPEGQKGQGLAISQRGAIPPLPKSFILHTPTFSIEVQHPTSGAIAIHCTTSDTATRRIIPASPKKHSLPNPPTSNVEVQHPTSEAIAIHCTTSDTATRRIIPASPANHPLPNPPTSSGKVQPPTSEAIAIRGIASLVASRRIVLVSSDNYLLDILSAEQEEALRRAIIAEVANYFYQRRNRPFAEQHNRHFLPPVDRPNVLPPIRAFWKLMGWVQRGPVAIAANLFGEAFLPPRRFASSRVPGFTPGFTPKFLEPSPSRFPDWAFWNKYRPVLQQPAQTKQKSATPPAASPQPQLSPSLLPDVPVQVRPVYFSALLQPLVEHEPSPQVASEPIAESTAIQPTKVGRLRARVGRSRKQRQNRELPTFLPERVPYPLVMNRPEAEPFDLDNVYYDGKAIDIKSSVVGYVRHPLAQLLGWIDLCLVWLERRVARLFRRSKRKR